MNVDSLGIFYIHIFLNIEFKLECCCYLISYTTKFNLIHYVKEVFLKFKFFPQRHTYLLLNMFNTTKEGTACTFFFVQPRK